MIRYRDEVGMIAIHEDSLAAYRNLVIPVCHGQAGMALDLVRVRARDWQSIFNSCYNHLKDPRCSP